MPTKDELEQELEAANARIAELEDQAAAAGDPAGTASNTDSPGPTRPDYLSAGEKADLEENGVATSPFDGSRLNAITEGVEVKNPTAQKRAERDLAERPAEVTSNAWPVSGAPPAEGGDTDPEHTNSRT